MSKLILILFLQCLVFSQDENMKSLKENFLSYIGDNKKKEKFLTYLEDTQNQNSEKTKLLLYLISEHRKSFLGDDGVILSVRLCPILLTNLTNEDLQISIFKILSSLDKQVLLSYKTSFLQLVDKHLNDGSLFMDHFSHFFLLEKGDLFPEILPLIIMDEEVIPEVIGEILLKYQSQSLLKDITKILKQNSEFINFQIIWALEHIQEINYLETINIINSILSHQNTNGINRQTKVSILNVFSQCLQKYFSIHQKSIFVDLDKYINTNQPDIRKTLFWVCCKNYEGILKKQNSQNVFLYLFPLILEELKTNPQNYSAKQLLLLLDKTILLQNKLELKNVFEQNIVELNDCLGKLILKEEGFIDLLTIFWDNPDGPNEDILFDIYDKYQEKTFFYLEKGLKSSDVCKRRIISVLLQLRNEATKKFLTKNFVEVFQSLRAFYSYEQSHHNFRILMHVVDVDDIIDIIILEKVDIFRYSNSDVYQKIISGIKKILRQEDFQLANYPYLQNIPNWRLEIPLVIIQDNDITLRKNLLRTITHYKMEQEAAIVTILYYLIDPNIEKEARAIIHQFAHQKIHTAFATWNKYHVQNYISVLELEQIRQKLIEIFGESFFMEENKE